jgi:hypothetical protein
MVYFICPNPAASEWKSGMLAERDPALTLTLTLHANCIYPTPQRKYMAGVVQDILTLHTNPMAECRILTLTLHTNCIYPTRKENIWLGCTVTLQQSVGS